MSDQKNLKPHEVRKFITLSDTGFAKGIPCFDERVAHLLYAAADYMLIPSRFEPCGLVALCSLRYGAIPIAAATGGLKDIVNPGNGFLLPKMGAENNTWQFRQGVDALTEGVKHALESYGRERFFNMRRCCMEEDVSWDVPARQWEALLLSLILKD